MFQIFRLLGNGLLVGLLLVLPYGELEQSAHAHGSWWKFTTFAAPQCNGQAVTITQNIHTVNFEMCNGIAQSWWDVVSNRCRHHAPLGCP